MTDANYADGLPHLANIPAQVEFLLHSLEQSIYLYVNADQTEFRYLKQKAIFTLWGKHLKFVDQFTHLNICHLLKVMSSYV